MLGSLFVIALAGATLVRSASTITSRACGNDISSEKVAAVEKEFTRLKTQSGATTQDVTTLNIYFHVISSDDTEEGGNLSDDQIEKQIDVINNAFAPASLTFVLVNTTRTVNTEWYDESSPGSSVESDMKTALRQGNAEDLNVYCVGNLTAGDDHLLGFATWPWDYAQNPELDGVVVRDASFPGSNFAPYNEGQTLTHEIGHWVGLYHTFQGGCSATGDEVSDTPPEAGPTSGCPASQTSCSGEVQDPFHNFMDYSDDSCLTEFTAGQIARLQDILRTFRGPP